MFIRVYMECYKYIKEMNNKIWYILKCSKIKVWFKKWLNKFKYMSSTIKHGLLIDCVRQWEESVWQLCTF